MRTLQLLGFLLAISAVALGFYLLAPIDSETSEASAGAPGLGIMFMVLPMLGWSALMLVPSSIALFKEDVRHNSYFKSFFWLSLWKLNVLISALYIAAVLYFAYVWVSVSVGN